MPVDADDTLDEPMQQQPPVDPDCTEDELEGDSSLAHSTEGAVEAQGGESTVNTTSAASASSKRARPKKRRVSGVYSKEQREAWQRRYVERKARLAREKEAAAAAQPAEAEAEAEETNEATEATRDGVQPATTEDEPSVKQEAAEAAVDEDGVISPAAAVGEDVVEKTERGRPLRASIKARQKQLEEEKKLEAEGRLRRRQEKLLAQTRVRTRVKKEEAATPSAADTAAASSPPLSPSAQPAPLSSLSSLPSSSSYQHPPPPPPPRALFSLERDKSRVVPSHCYGLDWRCVTKLTDCVYTQLHSSHSSAIDWAVVAAMMANVCPLSARECRLLWRSVAYGMDDDGYGHWKRLQVEYEEEADSDIDVELPGYDEAGVVDARTVVKSSQLRQCAKENTIDDWTAQHDHALLNVIAVWSSKSRQQQQQLAHGSRPTPHPRIALSLTSAPLSSHALPHLPSVESDWQFVANLFAHFGSAHKTPAFLHARFATLVRLALTSEGEGQAGREERARMRERVLDVLGVCEAAEGRDWLLHSGGRNWDEKRRVVDKRRSRRRQQQREASGATAEQKQALDSVQQTASTAAAAEEGVGQSQAEVADAAMAVEAVGADTDVQPMLNGTPAADNKASTGSSSNGVDVTADEAEAQTDAVDKEVSGHAASAAQ